MYHVCGHVPWDCSVDTFPNNPWDWKMGLDSVRPLNHPSMYLDLKALVPTQKMAHDPKR